MGFDGNLHTHTDFSLHDGFSRISDLVKRAKELKYKGLAITDHGTVSGLIPFYKECKKQGIKPILGCEMYFTHEITLNDSSTYHMLFLAKNLEGYKNLMRLNKYAHEHTYKKPRIDMAAIERYREGLICTTACLAGVLGQRDVSAFNDLEKLHDIFEDDLYVEIQPHPTEEQRVYNIKALKLAHDAGVKVVSTIDSHYVKKDDSSYHRSWLLLGADSDYYSSPTYYLMGDEEMRSFLSYLNKSDIEKSFMSIDEIIDKCNVEIPFGGQHYPYFCDDPERYIRDRCNFGYKQKRVSNWPNKKEHIERINSEIEMLKKVGYLNYMCIIDDMVRFCNKKGIRVGMGRGSVCGSDVAYMIGVTKIDPIKYDLVFERFCNPERTSAPDVDTDLQASRRNEVIDYVKSKYGSVYQVRTFESIAENSSMRRACKALGYNSSQTNEVCKASRIDNVDDDDVRDLASHFMGHIINYSTHASAVIVCPDDITQYTSIERQKVTKTNEYEHIVCYDFHDCEDMGLLKLDILGLKHLDTIQKILNQTGLDYSEIPSSDDETCKMINNGLTEGVFQSESDGFTKLLKDIHVKQETDFMIANALYRPGTLASGTTNEFIKRRNGLSEVKCDETLKDALKDTYGLILYQEQVMTCARKLCGYSLGQADNVRRIIGRKIKEQMADCLDDMKAKAKEIGTNEESVEQFLNVVEKSADYLFNKGHSAAYGITAWKSAYIKCHYTSIFFAELINQNAKDRKKVTAYVTAAKKMGIKVLKPKLGTPVCVANDEESMTLGTNVIKGVGSIEEFNGDSFPDVVKQYDKDRVESLIKGGALDSFDDDRGHMLAMVAEYKSYFNEIKRCRDAIDRWKSNESHSEEFKHKKIKEWENKILSIELKDKYDDEYDDEANEIEVLGFSFNDPFVSYDTHLVNNKSVFAGFVSEFKKHRDKNGHLMAFVNTSDGRNFVMFHGNYRELEPGKPYLIGTNWGGNIINSIKELERKNA